MNKLIYPVRISTPKDIRDSIKRIIQQLQKDNIAITSNKTAIQILSRNIPNCYKLNEVILISKTVSLPKEKSKTIIYLNPAYTLDIKSNYSFRIATKHKKLESDTKTKKNL